MEKVEISEDNEQDSIEAVRFDVETHVLQLEDVFRLFNCDDLNWFL